MHRPNPPPIDHLLLGATEDPFPLCRFRPHQSQQNAATNHGRRLARAMRWHPAWQPVFWQLHIARIRQYVLGAPTALQNLQNLPFQRLGWFCRFRSVFAQGYLVFKPCVCVGECSPQRSPRRRPRCTRPSALLPGPDLVAIPLQFRRDKWRPAETNHPGTTVAPAGYCAEERGQQQRRHDFPFQAR
jgi:hypothetical protein